MRVEAMGYMELTKMDLASLNTITLVETYLTICLRLHMFNACLSVAQKARCGGIDNIDFGLRILEMQKLLVGSAFPFSEFYGTKI